MLTSPNKSLLDEIDSFLNETGLSSTYLGKRAVGNSELVSRLRKGGRVWPETADALRVFMNKYRELKASKDAERAAAPEAAE